MESTRRSCRRGGSGGSGELRFRLLPEFCLLILFWRSDQTLFSSWIPTGLESIEALKEPSMARGFLRSLKFAADS